MIKNIPVRFENETYKELKIYAIRNELSISKAIEKLLKIAEEKGEK